MLTAKQKQEFVDMIDFRVNSVLTSLMFTRAKLAEVVSNDGSTLTIFFLEDPTNNIGGVPYLAGQTIASGNKVVVLMLNNTIKADSWICVKLA